MAATGFTPIQLYRTTTASAQPSAGNLADGELAINLTDKKLYAKDASNNVFVLADASSGGTTATNLAGGAAGSVPYQTGASTTTFLGIGTAAQVLQVNSGATAPEWVNTSGTGNVARTTSPSFTTPSLGAATALSINSLTLTTSTGTFTLANGKTLTVNNSLTLSGTDATTMTFPSTSATIARTDAAQTFTGTQTVQAAATQDAVALAGRAGGTSSYVSTLTPTTLSASRTVTLPDADTTVPVATQVLTFTGPTAGRTITLPDANFTVARSDAAQSFTGTQTFLSNPVLDAGTANGVLFLDGSKVVTSGSALTFDGTNFQVNGSVTATTGNMVVSAGKGVAFAGDQTRIFTPEDNVSGGLLQWAAGGVLRFNSGPSSELMRLTSTGLGIGTSSPTGKFTAQGSVGSFYIDAGATGVAFTYNGGNYISALGGSNATLIFETGGAVERMRLDASGNLGLGVTPSAWGSGKAIELGQVTGNALWGLGINSLYLTSNARWDGSNYVYTNNGAANLYGAGTGNGTFTWFIAPSGTAGNPISFTQAMTLSAAGGLSLGDTNDPGTGVGSFNGVRIGGNGSDINSTFNGASSVLTFRINGTERARVTSGGDFQTASGNSVMVGGTAARATTAGTNRVDIFDGTAPVGTLANGVSFYSASGEANVMDAAGNATLLSPHDAETNEWIFRSKHTPTGKVLKIDVERLLKFVNDHFGLDAVHEFIEA